MRVLESLYYAALQVVAGQKEIRVGQHDPYKTGLPDWSLAALITILTDHLEKEGKTHLEGETSIFIVPGMRFRVCNGLVTNFHQPGSTLLMLVEAFIGLGWEQMYDEALRNGYRMLSYGDSSLLIPGVIR